jgi:hypothetical protein
MLSRRTQELLERITGNPAIGKGKKLVIGDGAPHLEADTVRFVKSLTTSAQSDLVKSHLAGAHIAPIGGHVAFARGFAKLAKRAAMVPITTEEMLGATPTVAPIGSPRSEAGLSDADLRVLEQEITSGNPGIAPAQAAKLFMETYRVIAANPARRLTTESDAYGTPAVPSGYTN